MANPPGTGGSLFGGASTTSSTSSSLGSAASSVGSVVSSTTSSVSGAVSGVTSTVSNVATSATSEVSSVVSAASSAAGSAISSVEDMASNGIAAITSPITNIAVNLNNIENNVVGSVSGFIGNAEHAVASSVSSVIGGLFGNSKDNTSLKTGTPDNVKSSTVNGPIANGLYKTNNLYSQSTPVDLKNPLPQLTTSNASLGTIATRLGALVTDSESSLLNSAKNLTHTSLVSGIMGSARSLGKSYSNLMDLAHQGTTLYSQVTNLPSTLKVAGQAVYNQAVSGLAQDITGTVNGLNGYFNSSYPTTTMADGSSATAAGVNPNVPSSMLTSLYNAFNSKGCTYATVPGIYQYSAEESMKDAELSIAYAFGLKGLLANMTSCSNYNRTVQATGSSLFTQDFGNNPGTASVIGDALDPSTVQLPTTQAKAAITNSNVSDTDIPAISSTFKRFGIDASSLYLSDSSFAQKAAASGMNVMSISTLNNSSATMANAMLGSPAYKNGVPRDGLSLFTSN